MPGSLSKVFFVNSGSEANDLALRLARAHSMQQESRRSASDCVIAIDHAYHGHTLATLDVSPYKHRQGKEMECPPHVRKVPCPDMYRRSANQSNHGSEMDAAKYYAFYVKKECDRAISQGRRVSAFIMEGGMSVAGVILPPKSYIRQCADAVHEAGGLYIADEVQTGFGRLGKCTWAFQYSDEDNADDEVVPDIVTVGKPFGNGMPLAAVVTTPEIASSFESLGVEYFNTFAGSPVCCAAGLSMLEVLSTENLQENALQVGSYLQGLFRDLQSRVGWIGDIRGSGLFLGVDLVRDRGSLEPATQETSFVCR